MYSQGFFFVPSSSPGVSVIKDADHGIQAYSGSMERNVQLHRKGAEELLKGDWRRCRSRGWLQTPI